MSRAKPVIRRTALLAAGAAGVAALLRRHAAQRGPRGLVTRSAVPLLADLLRPSHTAAPQFRDTRWMAGSTRGELISATEIRVLGLNSKFNKGTAWRIDYTTSVRGRELSATGAVIRSENPWEGQGPRPVIAMAPGTQGTARHCDPSYAMTRYLAFKGPSDMIAAYEQPAVAMFVAAGCHVVLTDYPRDPASGEQLYCDHSAGAHALADAVRAARHLGVESPKVGLFGFSQGGGTVAAWLEDPEYASDIRPTAAVCGAPPCDLEAVLDHVDGAMASFVLPYAIVGIMASHDEVAAELAPHLTDRARETFRIGSTRCALGALPPNSFETTRAWTRSGHSFAELIDELPRTRAAIDAARFGSRPPTIPTRLWASVHDDIIPYHSTEKLARQWGIELTTRWLPLLFGPSFLNHLVPFFVWLRSDVTWLIDQLDG